MVVFFALMHSGFASVSLAVDQLARFVGAFELKASITVSMRVHPGNDLRHPVGILLWNYTLRIEKDGQTTKAFRGSAGGLSFTPKCSSLCLSYLLNKLLAHLWFFSKFPNRLCISPHIQSWDLFKVQSAFFCLHCRVCCQNKSISWSAEDFSRFYLKKAAFRGCNLKPFLVDIFLDQLL